MTKHFRHRIYSHRWSSESGLPKSVYFEDEIFAESIEIYFVNCMNVMNVLSHVLVIHICCSAMSIAHLLEVRIAKIN